MLEPLISLVRQEGFEPPTHGLEVHPLKNFLFTFSMKSVISRVLNLFFFRFFHKTHYFHGALL